MQRKKQHRVVLKNFIHDERTTPDRAILVERILKCLDAVDDDTLRMYEMQTIQHVGGPRLVEYYLDKLEHLPEGKVKRILRDDNDDGGHITAQNKLLRDRRSHPNRRLILQVEAMNEDAETQRERLFYTTIILAGCIDSRKYFKLNGIDDESIVETHLSVSDRAVQDQARHYLNAIMGAANAD